METKGYPFTGIWYVAVQETRTAGKWEREYECVPGEWIIGFTPKGCYIEIFRPNSEDRCIYDWVADEETGVISVVSPGKPETVIVKCVFDGVDGVPYIYHYDDMPHIPENASAIIEHHAHLRLKLIKVGKQDGL